MPSQRSCQALECIALGALRLDTDRDGAAVAVLNEPWTVGVGVWAWALLSGWVWAGMGRARLGTTGRDCVGRVAGLCCAGLASGAGCGL
eukprot:1597425-Alexandrium_andersonii.AAC.1